MKTNSTETAKQILANYLEVNNCRKTPERFAVLEAVYSFGSYFSMQDLKNKLVERNFPVSTATLYNTMRLLMDLRLVLCQRLQQGMRYKACYADNRCYQVCTVCGKTKELKIADIVNVFDNMHLKRFRKDNFSMYIYGICSTCQAVLTRQKNKK